MDNTCTPTYHKMWNRDFSLLIIAELLLCVACYMTIPFLPCRLYWNNYVDAEWACLTMGAFVAGIGISGLFGSWLIQRYRRNKVFLVSTFCLSATILAMSTFDVSVNRRIDTTQITWLMAACIWGGFVFGHAKRVLSCTLLIDKTESCHRTEANYAAIWISRLAVAAGPIAAILIRQETQGTAYYAIGAATALIAAILVMMVNFPFRAPEEGTHVLSIDRFFLPQGWNVAIVIALMGAALGIVMATHMSIEFLSAIAVGFVIAIILLKYKAVRTGKFTSAIGNVCILAAIAAMAMHNGMLDDTLKPMVLGLGYGMTSSEQLYKLLDHSSHCQRSTVESTYFMASDGGLFVGIAIGWAGEYGLGSQAAYGAHLALILFAVTTLTCSVNAIIKKGHKDYHA